MLPPSTLPDTLPSPIQEVHTAVFERQSLRLLVKRDDLLHPHISGNKWRKLKYNLAEARRRGFTGLLTFGGAYSNHLAATAAAGAEFGFSTAAIVRGERIEPLNATLRFAEECGMKLNFVSRTNYREKKEMLPEMLGLNEKEYYTLPEGGTNCLALPGCREIVAEAEAKLGGLPDYFCVPCGTGGTLAGIVDGLRGRAAALGVSVLKGDFHQKDIDALLAICGSPVPENWSVSTSYHFGGYAKFTPALIDFINLFKAQHGISLDPVYTGKLFFAIFDLAEKGFFKKGSTVLAVHTGGLQGIAGFNERFGNPICHLL
jgi:1-aminocyclopropane-1-carboxylate deaminase/D-cysteine desulfhydrase-like pyridoxal-dependent ACC family enzyme